jgi:hypothetical protein
MGESRERCAQLIRASTRLGGAGRCPNALPQLFDGQAFLGTRSPPACRARITASLHRTSGALAFLLASSGRCARAGLVVFGRSGWGATPTVLYGYSSIQQAGAGTAWIEPGETTPVHNPSEGMV